MGLPSISNVFTAEDAVGQLAAIVESSDDAIISKTLEGVILTWNSGAERVYGYSANEVIGKPLSILLPPDNPDELPGIMERLQRGESIDHYETVRRGKEGDAFLRSFRDKTAVRCHVAGFPGRAGDFPKIIGARNAQTSCWSC